LMTTASLWAYTLAVGADVPVVRAAIMFTIVFFSYAIYRQGNMLNSLGLCALILLAWRPSDLFNASFHLTFVSVAGIIAIAYPLIDGMRRIGTWTPGATSPFPPVVPDRFRRFCEMLYWRPDKWAIEAKRQMWSAGLFKAPYFSGRIHGAGQSILRTAFEGIVVSLVVQISMLPLLVVYFHRVPTVSVVLNLWVGSFIALESMAVVAGALLAEISEIMAAPFFVMAEALNWLLLALPRLITGHAWSGLRLPAYSGYGRAVYVLYFAALVVLAYGLYRWDPMKKITKAKPYALTSAALSALFLAIVFHPFSSPRPDGRLKIDFLDVGQGDAALVTFPDGRTMLVDGGGRMRFRRSGEDEAEPFEPDIRRIGESVVSEFLWHRGYSHVDYLLATHADTDHIQGLADVARSFSVAGAFVGQIPSGDLDLEELRHGLHRQNVGITVVSAGDMLNFDDVVVEILHPLESDAQAISSDNDSSVVIRIVYGNRSILLTGDIESNAEASLTAAGFDLKADVIKVPHHGSRTSSTAPLVNAVRPAIAVIPVGRRSPFGHPHSEVIQRWRAAGADVRTTGEKGTITISTDGRDLRIETFLP
jgi:competence protein ComEC